MKKVSLVLLYIVGLAVCLFYRFFQINTMVDTNTGFFLLGYENSNYVFYGLIAAFVVFLVFLGVFGDGIKQRKHDSAVIGVFSIFLGLVAVVMSIHLTLGFKNEIGLILYTASAYLFAVFLLVFGYCQIAVKKFPSGLAIIPILFSGIRLTIVFLNYYGLAKTIDVIIEIIMLIMSLLFWNYFCKFAVDMNSKITSRWLVGIALSASLLCFVATVPTYYSQIFLNVKPVSDAISTSYFDLATGIYIVVFLICSFVGQKKTVYEDEESESVQIEE